MLAEVRLDFAKVPHAADVQAATVADLRRAGRAAVEDAIDMALTRYDGMPS